MFANGCFVTDGNHRFDDPDKPVTWQGFTSKGPTRVGDNVWCGANVVITSGVTIGERCVIGANSVVTTDLPPFSIAAGAPARVLRTIEYPRPRPCEHDRARRTRRRRRRRAATARPARRRPSAAPGPPRRAAAAACRAEDHERVRRTVIPTPASRETQTTCEELPGDRRRTSSALRRQRPAAPRGAGRSTPARSSSSAGDDDRARPSRCRRARTTP